MNATATCTHPLEENDTGDVALVAVASVIMWLCMLCVLTVCLFHRKHKSQTTITAASVGWQLIPAALWVSGQLVANDHWAMRGFFRLGAAWKHMACVTHDLLWPYCLGEGILAAILLHRLVDLSLLWGYSRAQIAWARVAATWPILSVWTLGGVAMANSQWATDECWVGRLFICSLRPELSVMLACILASHLVLVFLLARFASVAWTAFLAPVDMFMGAGLVVLVAFAWMVAAMTVGVHSQPTQVAGTIAVLLCVAVLFCAQTGRMCTAAMRTLFCPVRNSPCASSPISDGQPASQPAPYRCLPSETQKRQFALRNMMSILRDAQKGPCFLRFVAQFNPFLSVFVWNLLQLTTHHTLVFTECSAFGIHFLSREAVTFDPYIHCFCRIPRLPNNGTAAMMGRIDPRGHTTLPVPLWQRLLWWIMPPTPLCRWPGPLPLARADELTSQHRHAGTRIALEIKRERQLRRDAHAFGVMMQTVNTSCAGTLLVDKYQGRSALQTFLEWGCQVLYEDFWDDWSRRGHDNS